MPYLMLSKLPRYECLLEAAKKFPDLDPSASEAFLYLLRAGDQAFSAVSAQLARHHITQGRFGVLMILLNNCDEPGGERRPLNPAELAERMGVTRATMTGLIDTLERDGLVQREAVPGDRRMLAVQITEKGNTLLENILPAHFKCMASLMSPLSHGERKTLVRLLTTVLQQAERLASLSGGPVKPIAN